MTTIETALRECLEALRPLAANAEGVHPGWCDNRRRASLNNEKPITVGDCRKAAAAINRAEEALKQQPAKEVLYQIRMYGSQTAWHNAGLSAYEVTLEKDRRILYTGPQPPQQPATEYEKQNPLGGPAKVFDAMADAIRAGDSYESVLKLYGYAETKANHPEQHLEMVSGDHSGDTNEMVAANAAPQPICHPPSWFRGRCLAHSGV